MRNKDKELSDQILAGLSRYENEVAPLPGIDADNRRTALTEQIIESVRRVKFAKRLLALDIGNARLDPNDLAFDPLRAAVTFSRSEQHDESCWLVFLFVHFGKHKTDGYQAIRDLYRGLGNTTPWTWDKVIGDLPEFHKWVYDNQARFRTDGVKRRFGNHRKYESWKADNLYAVIESYIEWVAPPRTHHDLFDEAESASGGDTYIAFDRLYKSMSRVKRFGRTARFDYLTMLGKLQLANIEPGSAYLDGATGPATGASLLFNGNKSISESRRDLDRKVVQLNQYLNVGMQVMEDSLCNWQKSPGRFIAFRG